MEIESITIKSENIEDYYPEDEMQIEKKDKERSKNTSKAFRCGVCGHCTTSDILLKVHLKMHLVKRIHQCNICKKCFSFVTELNNHMLLHSQERAYQSLLRDSTIEEAPPKANQQNEPSNKQFKNKNTNLPLNEAEKFLLVEQIEKLGLNIKYKEMEQIKTFLKNGWAKMVEIFAEHDYDRNPDKLARSYFHMKNQAKMHIERFYIHKKLPRPRKIDYIFLKLCPNDFEGLGMDMRELQEDSKIFENSRYEISEDEKIEETSLMPNDNLEDNEPILPHSEQSTSLKRTHSEEDITISNTKIIKTEDDDETVQSKIDDENIKSIKIKLLLAEDKRREKEHNLEVKRKELELKYREEQHKKDLELKNLEIMLLSQKIQQQRVQSRV